MERIGRQSGPTRGHAGQVRLGTLIGAVLTLGLVIWLGFELAGSESPPEAPSSSSARVNALAETAKRDDAVLPVVSADSTPKEIEGKDLLEPTAPTTAALTEGEPVSDQRPAHVERPGFPHRSYVAKEFFEERYADASLGELMEAKNRIEAEVVTQMNEATREFFDAGRAEETRQNREEAIANPQKNVTKDGLIMSVEAEVTPTGDLITRTARLPWNEYTDIYDSQDELFWLLGEVHRRSQVVQPSEN